MWGRKIPTLLELCIQTAIDNVRYLGDVGETDVDLLKEILSHCTVDQLTHIENSTKGRDLSPITDNLWKMFYEQQFGVESCNFDVEKMKKKKVSTKWRQRYEAKQRDFDKVQKRAVDRFKQRFGKEVIRKQSRQTQLCTKVPPSKKRSFFGGSGPCHYFSNLKGNLMKKAKMEYLNSHEAKVHAAMRKKDLQRNQCAPRTTTTAFLSKKTKPQSQISLGRLQGLNSSSVPPRTVTPNNIFRKDFASSSKPAKSLRRV